MGLLTRIQQRLRIRFADALHDRGRPGNVERSGHAGPHVSRAGPQGRDMIFPLNANRSYLASQQPTGCWAASRHRRHQNRVYFSGRTLSRGQGLPRRQRVLLCSCTPTVGGTPPPRSCVKACSLCSNSPRGPPRRRFTRMESQNLNSARMMVRSSSEGSRLPKEGVRNGH